MSAPALHPAARLASLVQIRARLAAAEEIDPPARLATRPKGNGRKARPIRQDRIIAPPESDLAWEVDAVLADWGRVIAGAPEGFPRSFALSIMKTRNRPGWLPTVRQWEIMRRLRSEVLSDDTPSNVELIEE